MRFFTTNVYQKYLINIQNGGIHLMCKREIFLIMSICLVEYLFLAAKQTEFGNEIRKDQRSIHLTRAVKRLRVKELPAYLNCTAGENKSAHR